MIGRMAWLLGRTETPGSATTTTSDAGVYRFDRNTGAFIDRFIPYGRGGLGDEPSGLAFGPDGTLVVGDERTGKVFRYNGTTGAFIDTIADTLTDPRAVAF